MPSVLVAELNEIERFGRVAALRSLGWRAEGVASDDLDGSYCQLGDFDVVLFGVASDRDSWDSYKAIEAVERLRRTPTEPRVLGVVAALDNPLLGVRLARAGVHVLWHRDDLQTVARLGGAVSGELVGYEPQPISCVLGRIGVGPRTNPAAVLDYVRSEGIDAAFAVGLTQSDTGLSRRRIMRIRRDITDLADLRTAAARGCGGPVRNMSQPTWSEVVAYVNLARGNTNATSAMTIAEEYDRSFQQLAS